ncbi:anthranilate synthase component I family protein [Nonlabens sp. Hel1_33_55]|uniref:anthranilate synthase component I family protein n=1 Tax=Nonlabens sp. Hel1_33_55 TaxID=1336802 RepID=UPI000B87FEC7|nr:anthranilate synthase component I family protein [Nonlabens sp. Hel1_33_55]
MNNERTSHSFSIENQADFKKRLLRFFEEENYISFLDSNDADGSTYSCLCGIGAIDVISCDSGNAFEKLKNFQEEHEDWLFGYLGYDLKNELEPLESKNSDELEFPDLQFFIPETVIEIGEKQVSFHVYEEDQEVIQQLLESILQQELDAPKSYKQQNYLIATDSKLEYLKKARSFLDHIQRGDIYEANLCTQFLARDIEIDSLKAFEDLNESSKPPFAAYSRCNNHFIISASPERYLKKIGRKLLSQPIKGTAARSKDRATDEQLKQELLKNQKERSENVMIVDLVRNDLSRVALRGSVKVSELFGLYSFPQVHHMISSITAQLGEQFSAIDAIKATFPMGSMTGAPKISAMKIIEKTESFKRGVYSGAVGYFKPDGDFDFNVVIRTILYNAGKGVVSVSVGSAITASAIPEAEYEECLIKAAALMQVLKSQGIAFS